MDLDSDTTANAIKLVIRVPCSGWGDSWTPIAAQTMESQAATMRLVRSRTDAPVPEIYEMDVTTNNEIEAPYFCINVFEGKEVWDYWYGPLSTEAMRLKILTSLARTMAQFAPFSFDKMGSVHQTQDGSYTVGQTYRWAKPPMEETVL